MIDVSDRDVLRYTSVTVVLELEAHVAYVEADYVPELVVV